MIRDKGVINAPKINLLEIILTLQQFWNEQAVCSCRPMIMKKGAGTMSPYTFPRAIDLVGGTRLASNLRDVQQMGVTAKTGIASTNIISFKL